MDETPEHEDTPDVPATSPLAQLRAKADKARRRQYVEVLLEPIDVLIRYAPVSLDRLSQISRRARDDAKKANMATLVEACEAILVIEDGQVTDLDPDGNAHIDEDGQIVGRPLTFSSPRLAEILELDGAKGPELVAALYGIAGRTMQIPRDSDDVLYLSRGETDRMTRPPGVSGAS